MSVEHSPARSWTTGRTALYLSAISLSAFLLFSLELYAGRVVLPTFGGTPAVWTTALCFFSATVFAGYSYAHLVATRIRSTAAPAIHATAAVLAVGASFAAPAMDGIVRHGGVAPVLDVLLALTLVAGAPALLLSTTTPLLSSWYADGTTSPWWLYAASNAASLAGLLTYPLLVEPSLPLSGQRAALNAGLVVLCTLLGAIAIGRIAGSADVRGASDRAIAGSADVRGADAPAGSTACASKERSPVGVQMWWLFAAAVPSGLLAATTTHIATDHVSAPLLWVGPLSVYLASFVVAFSRIGPPATRFAERLVPAASTLMLLLYLARIDWPPLVLIPLMLAAYGVLAVAVHGSLAATRPAESQLTRFYLLISAGGLMATAAVALAAPLLFNGVYEFPLLVVGALAVLATVPGTPALRRDRRDLKAVLRETGVRLAPYVVVTGGLLVVASRDSADAFTLVAVVAVVGFQVIGLSPGFRSLSLASAIAVTALMLLLTPSYELRTRTFFGVTEVRATLNGTAREEIHGTTLHGLQFVDDRASEPTSYFVRSGPLGDVFVEFARRAPRGGSIGVVGLGVGTIASYAREGDRLTFFEVDPEVVRIAQDRRYFTYLTDSPDKPRMVLGDGRLSLAAEPSAGFDVLLLDAFASDAVPTHLLTREALGAYSRTLRPHGVIVFQLTNRHFDLAPAVAATARSVGLDAMMLAYDPPPRERERFAAKASRWLVAGRPGDLDDFEDRGWVRPADGVVLTDDYSDVLRLLRAR